MTFVYRRSYTGPLRAAIFDWAGTTVDYGSFAPVSAVVEVFQARSINVTIQQARAPMGMAKRDHIRAVAQMTVVSEQWAAMRGGPPTEADVDAMFRDFLPLEVTRVANYASLIPGTRETVAACRERGIKIGSCTGYGREIMDVILPLAAEQGYAPDSLVTPEDVPAGRPEPWMALQNAINLRVYPAAACVKVGDTISDIEEGLNAEMWTIALARSGNELGLTEAEIAALHPQMIADRLAHIYQRLRQAGAHFVVDSIADVPLVLDEIASRLARGERP